MTRFWIALACYCALDIASTWASARWLDGAGRRWLLAAVVGYSACTGCWLVGVAGASGPSLTRALAIYPVVALLVGVLTGMLATGERLDARGWVGVACGVLAVGLLAGRGA